MKKLKENKIFRMALSLALMLVLGVSIAYAALSATLNITFGNVTQNALTWNIAFQGSSATGTSSGTSSTGLSCGKATISGANVTVADTTLSKPDDKCTWTLTIKNSGTVAGTLGTITPTAPSGVSCTNSGASMVCGNITYKLTTDAAGGTLLTTGGTLAANGTRTIYLVAMYNASGVQGTAITQTGAKFALVYNQA